MKDIDFDELDRAVSSVLTSSSSNASNEIPTSQQVSTSPVAPTPISPTVSAQPTTSPMVQTRQTITPSPAVRRSGRFMDVVHPSSDMKSATTTPVRKPRLQPISATVTPEPTTIAATPAEVSMPDPLPETVVEPDEKITVDEPKLTPIPTEEHPTLDTLSAPSSDVTTEQWPDPLSLEETAPLPETPTDVITNPEPVQSGEVSQTPFIADAKVDKRPLGGYGDATFNNTDDAVSDPDDVDGDVGSPVAIVPRELEDDVVALDANETDQTPPPANKLSDSSQTVEAAEPSVPVTPVATSIPQQYKAADTTGDSETHAIFDTDSYHQPLSPPKASKKRLWIWIILVVGLLVVGAGLGALWYMAGF